jgi:acyl carrier protein
MSDAAVEERVRKVVAELLKVPEEKVTPSAHFVKDLGMESVQSIELIAAFEEEFDLDIEQDEVASIFTVEGASAWIEEAIKKQNA